MKLFKKRVIFYMTYKDKYNSEHGYKFCEYSIFTNRKKIITDFNDWIVDIINKKNKFKRDDYAVIENIKIIGL